MVTNHIEIAQYLRYHMVPAEKPRPTKNTRFRRRRAARVEHPLVGKTKEIGRPYEGFCLIFDTETTTFRGQQLRFGTYQIRGIAPEWRLRLARRGELTREQLDTLQERGLFYAEENLTSAEIDLLHRYAALNQINIMTRPEFARDVLVGTGRYRKEYWQHDGLTIGFNLAFDIGALATDFWLAQGDFYGGFGFKMCDCGGAARKHCAFHPGVRVKPIAPRKHIFDWCTTQIPTQCRGSRDWGRYNKRRTKFLDTSQFARALLGPDGGGSLENLCSTLKTHTQKRSRNDHEQPITFEYLDYAMTDVQATWEVYTKLRDLYRRHGISRPMWKIYSEASVGKGYFAEIGVPKVLREHPTMTPTTVGKFMSAFYGGRSEARIRMSPREVMLCDFKSEYATVNALMRLQDLLLAEHIEIRPDSIDARQFLATVTLNDLQKPANWPRLRGIAKVEPCNDILPVRSEFAGVGSDTNIAVCNLISGPPVYYTFADLVTSKLLTGRCPKIIETIELIPHGRRVTKPWKLFGDDRYFIDLSIDDLFTRLIDLRTEFKELAAEGPEIEKPFRNMLQTGLKLLASSTSYGTLLEYVEDERAEARLCNVFRSDREEGERHRVQRLERPGPFFAGPIGVLIPAAGRLLLAIAERLGLDRGIHHVFCDTDSMCFARPDGLDFSTFAGKVQEIVDWFTPLSPYQTFGSVFQIEVGEPGWRCLAIAAKRYAIYRHGDKAKEEADIVFKAAKLSSHGMGAIRDPEGYRSIFPDAPPRAELERLVSSKTAAGVIYDIWREAITAVEADKPVPTERAYLRPFPYFNRAAIGNAHQMRLYQSLDGVRAFSFFSTIPPMVADGGLAVVFDPDKRKRLELLAHMSMYGPHASSFDEIVHRLHFRDDGNPVALTDSDLDYLRFQTIEDRVRHYFDHPEHKAFPPAGTGLLERRNVAVTHFRYMGKETFPEDEFTEFSDKELKLAVHRRALTIGRETGRTASGQSIDTSLREKLRCAPMRELGRLTKISRDTLGRYKQGVTAPDAQRRAAILAALERLEGAAAGDKIGAKQARRLRSRIKALSAGPVEISSAIRVMKAVEGRMNRACFKLFMFRNVTPSLAELDLLTATVLAFEREDFLVGPASVKGTVARVRYLDRTTEFGVLSVNPIDSELLITVVGKNSRYLGVGMRVFAEGFWEYNEEFGSQVVSKNIDLSLPSNECGIRRYLGSGSIPGIGRVLADRLFRHFGKDVFRIALEDPNRILMVKGITMKMVVAIQSAIKDLSSSRGEGRAWL